MKFLSFLAIAAFGILVGAGSVYWWLTNTAQLAASADVSPPLYWVAPMDPNYKRDKPGLSPMGMELIPVYKNKSLDLPAGTVSISPSVENNLGVKLGHVKLQNISLPINTVGFIQFNEKSISHIHSRVEGWIDNLSVNAVGDPVNKGQVLFTLYSPQLVNAQEELVAELQTKNQSLVKGAIRKLTALGVDDAFIKSLRKTLVVKQQVPFFAPNDGFIATLNVRDGAFIQPSKEVLSIGGLQRVWVMAEIFERQAAWIKAGLKVRMTTDTYPGDAWLGTVDYVHPVLDPQTRTLRARIVFNNADHRLKPNMFARLTIQAGVKHNVLTIPREAIIYQGGMSRVVKQVAPGQYRSVKIQTGIESGNRVEVTQGLKDHDQVVTSSQFLIDSESSLTAELSRIEFSGTKNISDNTPSVTEEHNHD